MRICGSCITICLVALVVFVCARAADKGPDADKAAPTTKQLLSEFQMVDRQAYFALEGVPARGWGDQEIWRPLYAVRDRLRRATDADRKRLARTAPSQLAAVHEGLLKRLHVEPVATITVGADGTAKLDPASPALVAYANVPTAAVFRLVPAAVGGKISVPKAQANGVSIDAQELTLARWFGQFLVLPVVATGGEAGKRTVSLKVTVGDKKSTLPLAIDVRPSGTLAGSVKRKGDGQPLTAKLFVEDEKGRLYVVPGERNYRTQYWFAPWQPRFSYVEKFAIPLPPGKYRVTAMKGYGYPNETRTVEVKTGETAELGVEMTQLRPLEQEGWFSADMHIHGSTTLSMLRGEDINVAAHTHYSSHRPMKLTVDESQSDETHLTAMNQEIEHWNYGNSFYFNIPTTVQDPKTPKPDMTPLFHYDQQAHEMGGITFRWLRGREFKAGPNAGQAQPELAVSAALGYMDVWTVLENSMQNLLDSPGRKWNGDGWGGSLYERTYKTWYAFMNCGLRIPVAGGTSYGRLSRLGYNRVYAKVNGPLTVASWADAVKRGDGFVTNGPLLWLKANGRPCGEGVALDGTGEVNLTVELVSRHPVRLVEIVRNGKVVASREMTDPAKGMTWEYTAKVAEPSWFAARCFGEYEVRYKHMAAPNQFAHTNAVFVTVGGKKPSSPADAARFVKEIDALIEYAPNIPTEELRARALAEYDKARKFYAEMAGK